MEGYPDDPRGYVRPLARRRSRDALLEPRRSNAAIPVVVVVVLVAAYLARFSVVLPGVFGLALLFSGTSFLSTRINPLSPHYYLTRKPSWAAVGVVFLGAIVLLALAYELWVHRLGPILPHL